MSEEPSPSTFKSNKRKASSAKVCATKKARASTNKPSRVIGYRCAPHIIPEIMRQLDGRQHGWVSEMGFGPASSMLECRLPKGLTVWLIHQVDCPKKSIIINSVAYPIKDYISDILGFSNGNILVPLLRGGLSKSKPFKGKKEFRDRAAGKGAKLADAINTLVKMQDKEEFYKQFAMVFLCVNLAPTSGHIINIYYAYLINWSYQTDELARVCCRVPHSRYRRFSEFQCDQCKH